MSPVLKFLIYLFLIFFGSDDILRRLFIDNHLFIPLFSLSFFFKINLQVSNTRPVCQVFIDELLVYNGYLSRFWGQNQFACDDTSLN